MWPFTSRRIFGNRWWAIGFVIVTCYQAVDCVSDLPAPKTVPADTDKN